MTDQVERDGYDQFWDVVESAPVHHGHTEQPIDALRSAWLVRDLTEDDFRVARAAIAAMQKDAAMDRLVAEGQRCEAMTPDCIHVTAEMAVNCPTCNPSALCGLPTTTPQEAAKVLLDRWLVGEFENTADAAADDVYVAGNDSIAITETWLRTISEDSHE